MHLKVFYVWEDLLAHNWQCVRISEPNRSRGTLRQEKKCPLKGNHSNRIELRKNERDFSGDWKADKERGISVYNADVCKVEFDCTFLIRGGKGTGDAGVFLILSENFCGPSFSLLRQSWPSLITQNKNKTINQRWPSTVIEPDNPSYLVLLPWGISWPWKCAFGSCQKFKADT